MPSSAALSSPMFASAANRSHSAPLAALPPCGQLRYCVFAINSSLHLHIFILMIFRSYRFVLFLFSGLILWFSLQPKFAAECFVLMLINDVFVFFKLS